MSREMTKKEFIELITSTIEQNIKEMGVGQVEAKNFAFDGKEPKTEEQKAEKVKEFFKSLLFNDFNATKALSGGVDEEGGFLIPTEFKAQLIEGIRERSIMRPLVTVMPVGNRSGEMPVITSKPSFAFGTENAPFNESTATFGQITYNVARLDVFVPISRELLSDSAINLERLLRRLFVEQYAKAEDIIMTVGGGTVTGVQKDTNIASYTPTAALTYDDIVDAFFSIDKYYRENTTFMVSPMGLKVLRKLKDGDGNPLLMHATEGGMPTIFGRPVVENNRMEDTLVDPDGVANSGDEYFTTDILIGDFKNAYLFDRGEFAVESTKEGNAFLSHQIWIKSWNRIDFKVVLPESFIKITGVQV